MNTGVPPITERETFEEKQKRWEFFSFATTRGAHDLRQALGVDEASFRMVVGSSHPDARAYYVYQVLDEVQKVGVAILGWQEFLSSPDDEKKFSKSSQLDRVVIESMADQQSMWSRKLLEVLVNLISFRQTNEDAYYRHLLLLADLDYFLSLQEDLEAFYSCRSHNAEYSVSRLLSEIGRLEAAGFDISKCWYLKDKRPTIERSLKPGRIFASVYSRLHNALRIATEADKLAMGFSYRQFFSTTSRDLHFDPSSLTKDYDLRTVERGIGHCGVLGLRVLVLSQQLTGLAPDGVNAQVRQYYESDREHIQFCERLVGGRATVGDFVLAGHDLAEVVEVRTSKFGYEAYRVRYLAERPIPEIAEDWFIARFILVIFRRKDRTGALNRFVSEGKLPQDVSAKLNALPPATQDHLFREAVVDLWNRALRDYFARGRTAQTDRSES